MSTESIVNRVSQNFVQDELAKLGPSEKQLNVWDTPEGEKVLGQIVEQAAVDLGYAAATALVTTPDTEDPSDSIGNTTDATSALASLIVSKTEFDKFRAQVIMALKHNGIDTRRFFPE